MPIVSAESYVVNSADWRDIYSGIMFGRVNDKLVSYLPSDKAGDYVLGPHKNSEKLYIISSKKLPFKFGYEETVRNLGFDVEENAYQNINLELLKLLANNITKFIVIDDSYGYNAISIAPLASLDKYFVLFIDKDNLNQYLGVLQDREIDEMIIYGIVDRQVYDALQEFDPIIINDEGDRFRNNVAITKIFRERFFEINGQEANQVILTNGEFIEDEILSGTQPVLFIGRMNVPDVTAEYIKSSTISVGVLIGNELIDTAQYVKNVVGIYTFVKFGRSARNPSGLINEVEDLDRYPVPKVSLGAEFVSVKYNTLTSQMMVTIKNVGPIAIYLKGTYSLSTPDNNPDNIRRFGDQNSEFLESGETKTFLYDIDRIFDTETLNFDGFMLFGESKYSLEFRVDKKGEVEFTEYSDDSLIDILDLVYYKNQRSFEITVVNLGSDTVFFNLELLDIIIMDIPQSFGAGQTYELGPGQQMKVNIDVLLDEGDYDNNPTIKVTSYYGKQEDGLIKRLTKEFDLEISSQFALGQYVPTAIIIILIILILLDITKKKCPNCKAKNPKSSRHCKKCGHTLK